MKCLNCNKEINDGAKFCKYCGSKVLNQDSNKINRTCTKCGQIIPENAKFCKYCGEKIEVQSVTSDVENKSVDTHDNYITWHIMPGQLALKIDEEDIEAYNTIKGVYIAPGTKALFFVNGKFAATLDSGTYPFSDLKKTADHSAPGTKVAGFIGNIANHIANGVSALFGGNRSSFRDNNGNKLLYTVVLVRGVEFPLIFDLKKVPTANFNSDIGIHIRCKISNLNLFFEDQMVDKKILSVESFANHLSPYVHNVVFKEAAKYSTEDINTPAFFDAINTSLKNIFSEVYSYLTIAEMVKITTEQAELEHIRQLKDELYIAEKELEHLQLRQDYLNRLQSVENDQKLRDARARVDFEALMDEIDKDDLLNRDKKQQFVEMLEAQSELRTAKTDSEKQVALNKLKQTTLLSNEEVESLQRAIQQRANMDELSNAHAIALATVQNQAEIDKETLRWEIEIGNKRFENDITRQRMAAEFADERRNADFEFEKKQMANQMDMLRQAQALREEREQAQHNREIESQRLKYDAELEKQRIHATMSFEQIMASNPDITPEAAAALAKKFEAEAATAQNDKTVDIMRQHDEDLKQILAQQMSLTRDIVAAQNQVNANALANKQQELDRIHRDSERSQDRYMSGVQTTLNAVSATRANYNTVDAVPNKSISTVFCPNCGKKHPEHTIICDECGESL